MKTIIILYHKVRYYIAALREYPKGIFCGWCGNLNTMADDCGFWWINPTQDDTRVCCQHCYDGPLGKAHIERYGQGER